MVRRHVAHGGAGEKPDALELAAVEQHLTEARVVRGRAGRAGATGIVLRRHGDVEQLDRLARRLVGLVGLGKARGLRLRYQERSVVHLERREDSLAEEPAERRARHHFDDAAEHVGRQAVLPGAPGLMGQRHLGEPLDLLGRRDVAPVDADLGVELLHLGVAREAAVHEARRVAQQVLNRHLALGRHQCVHCLAGVGVEPGNAHLEIRELGQILRDGIAQHQPPLFDEHHRGDRRERLGHRIEAEDRVLRHRRSRDGIALADALEVGDLPLAGHQGDGARVLATGYLGLHDLGRPREALGREPDFLGLGGRQAVGPDEGREQKRDEDGNESRESRHGGPP